MLLGALAGRVDVQDHGQVGSRQRLTELAREQRRARIQMGLEDGHQAAVLERAGRVQGGEDLARMVGVVVVEERTACAAPEQLKAPVRSAKAGKARDRRRRLGAGQPAASAPRRR